MDIREDLGAGRVVAPPRALPQPAERLDAAPPVAPARVRARRRAALPRLDLVPRTSASAPAPIRSRWGSGSWRSSPSAARCTTPRPTPAASCSAPSPRSASASTDPPAIGAADRHPRVADADAAAARRGHRPSTPTPPRSRSRAPPTSSQSAPWGPLPDDIPTATAIELYDVYGAGSHTRDLAPATAGPSASSAPATPASSRSPPPATRWTAARSSRSTSTPTAIDRVAALGLCDVGVVADLRDPLGALEAVAAAGVGPADLTVVVVNATGCEPTAILLTATGGTVLFYSMATSFQTAALTADGQSAGRHDDRRQRLRARRRRLRARPLPADAGAAGGARGGVVEPDDRRRHDSRRCAGRTSTASATSTTRSSSPTSRRAATPSCASTGSAATSTSSAAARSSSTARSSPARRRSTVECGVRELGTKSLQDRRADPRPGGEPVVEAEFGLVLWDPEARGTRPITDAERASLSRSEVVPG